MDGWKNFFKNLRYVINGVIIEIPKAALRTQELKEFIDKKYDHFLNFEDVILH